MTNSTKRWSARLLAPALLLGGVALAPLTAPAALADTALGNVCAAPASAVTVFSFNDFHGRIEQAAKLFTVVEDERAAKGDSNVALVSSGDNIGGSTFVSMIQNDEPTLDVLGTIKPDAIATGNHEYDKGWPDLSGRVIPWDAGSGTIPYLAANIYTKGTKTQPAGLTAYTTFVKGGLKIAVIGAVTGDLHSLVSPDGISMLDVGDPAAAVNAAVKTLPADVDVIIASFHEGAPNEKNTIDQNSDASGAFAEIAQDLDPSIDVIFNGHTHQAYNWVTNNGTPIMQAGDYARYVAKVQLGVDAAGEYCGIAGSPALVPLAATAGTYPRILAINDIVAAAVKEAAVLGQRELNYALKAISTPGSGGSGVRNVESPMSNMVAEMFYQTLSNGNTEFIGMQNPGGTRTSFNKGTITFEEAALVLPFANTLMTTELTGAQVKRVLEQQWQRDADGKPFDPSPSRPFLAMGISKNLTYTFDENREWGDRITSIHVNGAPIDMAKAYTVGSGSFLIAGGDNFWEFRNGVNRADTGKADLETWVNWIGDQEPLGPDYTKRGVSLPGAAGSLKQGAAAVEFTLGLPMALGVAPDTLDMLLDATGDLVSPQLFNQSVKAYLGDLLVGEGTVTDGVAKVGVAIPANAKVTGGAQTLRFVVASSGTQVLWPVQVEATVKPTKPGLPSTGV